jgi:hypothetical protein
MFQTG